MLGVALAALTLAAGAHGAAAARPPIVWNAIPYSAKRKSEMSAYSRRHYGFSGSELRNPKVIVEHLTESSTFSAAWNTFAPDVADSELHELPGVCAHFIICLLYTSPSPRDS